MLKRFGKMALRLLALSALAFVPVAAMASTTIGNNVSVGGTLAVTGATTLTGAATLSSTLSVTGLSTLTGGFISNASSSVGAGLQVAGALSASGTLGVAGAATLSSSLAVTGATTLTGLATANGGVLIPAGNNLNVSSTVYLNGIATTSPTGLALNGNLTTGNNAAYNIGAFGNAFNNIYASGTIYAGTLSTLGSGLTISTLGTFQGGELISAGNLNVSTTLFLNGIATSSATGIALNGNLTTGNNNAYGIGAFGNSFTSVFTSGTVYAATSTVVNPLTNATATIYAANSAASTNVGGAIVLKAYNGTCYSIYIGNTGNGSVTLGVTSTALAACPGY